MLQGQPAFNELIFQSTGMLERVVPTSERNPFRTESLGASGSIDDFLSDERQRRTSIQTFMCKTEEPSLLKPQHNLGYRPNDSSTILLTSSTKISSASSSDLKLTERCREKKSKASSSGSITSQAGASTPKVNSNKRCPQPELTAEEREERRKSKNREYQRRFREKKMRLQFQRQSPATPAAGDCTSPSTIPTSLFTAQFWNAMR